MDTGWSGPKYGGTGPGSFKKKTGWAGSGITNLITRTGSNPACLKLAGSKQVHESSYFFFLFLVLIVSPPRTRSSSRLSSHLCTPKLTDSPPSSPSAASGYGVLVPCTWIMQINTSWKSLTIWHHFPPNPSFCHGCTHLSCNCLL